MGVTSNVHLDTPSHRTVSQQHREERLRKTQEALRRCVHLEPVRLRLTTPQSLRGLELEPHTLPVPVVLVIIVALKPTRVMDRDLPPPVTTRHRHPQSQLTVIQGTKEAPEIIPHRVSPRHRPATQLQREENVTLIQPLTPEHRPVAGKTRSGRERHRGSTEALSPTNEIQSPRATRAPKMERTVTRTVERDRRNSVMQHKPAPPASSLRRGASAYHRPGQRHTRCTCCQTRCLGQRA